MIGISVENVNKGIHINELPIKILIKRLFRAIDLFSLFVMTPPLKINKGK